MTTTVGKAHARAGAEAFQRDGYFMSDPVIPPDLIRRVIPRMDALIRGEYETGTPPHSIAFKSDDPPEKLKKIDQPQLCDRTIMELISHPALGELAARVTGGRMIQVWAVQQLVKPPGGVAIGSVGWHQDWLYWNKWWREGSEVFTAWVEVSDVGPDCGPMTFLRGSHTWGFRGEGDFWGTDLDRQREEIHVPKDGQWDEVPALLPAGGVSFHHRLTFHGSGPNQSDLPRRSFALHMRTENSAPASDRDYYTSVLDDHSVSPVIHDAR